MSDYVQPYRLQPARLLCAGNSPGKNTGGGCHFLLQGTFPTQGSNPRLLHLLLRQVDSLPLSHQEALEEIVRMALISMTSALMRPRYTRRERAV